MKKPFNRFRTAAFTWVAAIALFSGPTTVLSADKVKLRVYNGAAFTISRMALAVDRVTVDKRKANILAGDTKSLNWVVDKGGSLMNVAFDYSIESSPVGGVLCGDDFLISTDSDFQLTKAVFPSGKVIEATFDAENQVLVVDYKISGSITNRLCKITGTNTSKR
ncbi:MAG: hypothetical protein R3F37_05960 [Candidatus Competibacteraceae bacterium]